MYIVLVRRSPFSTKSYSCKFRDPVKAMKRVSKILAIHSIKKPLSTFAIYVYKETKFSKYSENIFLDTCFEFMVHQRY